VLTNQTGGRNELMVRHARSGTFHQYLQNQGINGNALTLSHSIRYRGWLESDDIIFLPYGFLYLENPDRDFVADAPELTPCLEDFRDPKFWLAFSGNASVRLTSPADAPDILLLEMVVPSKGVDGPHISSEYRYEVRLSKKNHYFPLGYKAWNKAGQLVAEVSAEDIVEPEWPGGVRFRFAKKAITKTYNEKGELTVTSVCTVNDVKINDIGPDAEDDVFHIDPAMADYIQDMDKGAVIAVPK
jgi:hypothetical protein